MHFERHRDLIFACNSRTFLERHRLLYKYTFRYHLKAYLFSSCLFSQQSQTDLILVPRLSIENELVEPLTSVDHTQALRRGDEVRNMEVKGRFELFEFWIRIYKRDLLFSCDSHLSRPQLLKQATLKTSPRTKFRRRRQWSERTTAPPSLEWKISYNC